MTESSGYHLLSSYMVDEHYEIFRQFKLQANRDLLYLQAELVQLEDELLTIVDRDRKLDGEQKHYDYNWHLLSTSQSRCGDGEQWEKILQIRNKLKEYYESVSRFHAIVNLPETRKRDVKMLRDRISRRDLGGIPFSGSDLYHAGKTVYDDMFVNDLTILKNRAGENDHFTRFLAGPVFHGCERVLRLFKDPVPLESGASEIRSSLFRYSDAHVIGFIDILGTVIASMTPLTSIIILYFVQNLGVRLGVLCACTFLFSMSLAIVTKARRIEVFACTAAFASVQVVFVGSTSSLGCGG
ncbi:hypothetical protein BKA61DRAFT_675254 [Leptodontidium sp. MPI-SDFR-AT-0119]|nr:hypothetical protein BKA61DRAFT_675254 [Leptodontidium sp. MPI-SDFR-AT-0119]